MNRYIILISLLVSCFACNAAPGVMSFQLAWTMADNPGQKRIEVQYRNSYDKDVCISEGAWPRGAGYVDAMSDSMLLVVGQRRFPIEDFQAGSCIGKCAIRVLPGESIRANIDYKRFGLPEELRFEGKALIYPLIGSFCAP
jgi:hypothetical protein